jgi:uncharacterized protein (DUF952 family)
MKKFIFKICYLSEWNKFKKKGKFYGSKKDISDGYIHFSNKNQIKSTLNKYFKREKKLVLLKVNIKGIKNLVWERSRKGEFFPHLYSHIELHKVKKIYKIILKKDGAYSLN